MGLLRNVTEAGFVTMPIVVNGFSVQKQRARTGVYQAGDDLDGSALA